jgi:UDP-glucuronate 4-epimerase
VKILVTGAAGFIGSHLVEECLRRGWEVVAIDSLTTYYSPTAKVRNADHFRRHHRCTYLEQDILDVDLPSVLDGATTVFHLAAQAGVRASWGQSFDVYTQLNITVLQRLLEAARGVALEKFVFASSSSVYGDAETLPTPESVMLRPVSPYGATKALGEHLTYLYFRNYGIPTVDLRFFSVYGPRQRPDMAFHRFCAAALRGETMTVFGDGFQTRDFTYIDDIVAATIAAGEADVPPGSVYNLGGGSQTSVRDALDVIAELSGRSIDVAYTAQERGDVRDTSADTSRARAELGFAPQTSVRDGLAAELSWVEAMLEEKSAVER